MGKRTAGKLGAPFRNRNRLLHGRYTQERVERRARACTGDEKGCERDFNDQGLGL
jgi:hypothetical protein